MVFVHVWLETHRIQLHQYKLSFKCNLVTRGLRHLISPLAFLWHCQMVNEAVLSMYKFAAMSHCYMTLSVLTLVTRIKVIIQEALGHWPMSHVTSRSCPTGKMVGFESMIMDVEDVKQEKRGFGHADIHNKQHYSANKFNRAHLTHRSLK